MDRREEIEKMNSRLSEIETERNELEEKIRNAVMDIIKETGSEEMKSRGKTGNKFVMKFSDFAGGKPWGVDYHDWEKQGEYLMDYFEMKRDSKTRWKELLEDLIETAGKSLTVSYKIPTQAGKFITRTRQVIFNEDFLRRVYDRVFGNGEM
jgi:hypothetical protein